MSVKDPVADSGDGSGGSADPSSGSPSATGKSSAPPQTPLVPARIHKLDQAVINRIAAGEVVQRPASALKELLENSLDAGSTRVQVLLQDGGLKLLQITDDGCGIAVEDFPIVCERFTTSKIETYSDLRSVATFGFRGEALASITHVAHVSITSMTRGQPCAYRASFSDGKLIEDPGTRRRGGSGSGSGQVKPSPCAGVPGTVIKVADLFYNVPLRRQALTSGSEEYNHCLRVVSGYALHFSGVGMSARKVGSVKADVQTCQGASKRDNIRVLYGAAIEREIVEFNKERANPKIHVEALGTNANFSQRNRFTLVLFINNRLVENSAIKKCLSDVYARYLPRHAHPWVYLSLTLPAENVDVNVHPTKNEVHFLYEEETLGLIEETFEEGLKEGNASRIFYTQTLISQPKPTDEDSNVPPTATSEDTRRKDQAAYGKRSDTKKRRIEAVSMDILSSQSAYKRRPSAKKKDNGKLVDNSKPYRPERMVRTDHTNPSGRLEAYFQAPDARILSGRSRSRSQKKRVVEGEDMKADPDVEILEQPSGSDDEAEEVYTSVQNLRSLVEEAKSTDAQKIFKEHTFVGVVDDRFSLIQHSTKLYLIDVQLLSYEFFYQHVLWNFSRMKQRIFFSCQGGLVDSNDQAGGANQRSPEGNNEKDQVASKGGEKDACGGDQKDECEDGRKDVAEPTAPQPTEGLRVYDLARLALDLKDSGWKEGNESKEVIARRVEELLVLKGPMLDEYFSIGIRESFEDHHGYLYSVPRMLENYTPPLLALPRFILRLATHVNWEEEEPCFRDVSERLAELYMVQPGYFYEESPEETAEPRKQADDPIDCTSVESSGEPSERIRPAHWQIRNVLFPEIKQTKWFLPPATLLQSDEKNQGAAVTQIAALEKLYRVFERC